MANRLLLPAAGHFDQVAAFLCTELLRNGAAKDLQTAFRRTEPVLELAIERLRIADRAILGLSGELVLLDALLRATPDPSVAEVIDGWAGYGQSTRDISLGAIGVEVKTTTRSTSSHMVQGVHQVETTHDEEGRDETALFLVSIGLEWVDHVEAELSVFRLPQLVDSLTTRVMEALGETSGTAVVYEFLRHVSEYGSSAEIGYDHRTMAGNVAFHRPFRLTFVRCYDMRDDHIQVLRSDDIRRRPNTELKSVTFRINLPEQVRGDENPTVGLNAAAQKILRLGLDV